MSTETKYDVFISSKSEDYHLAEKVYNFLTGQGLSVFLASKILKKLGESEYASKIDEVLDNSTHLIVVSSKLDHINSKWVKYEWSLFSSDLKSGYRQGNLLTILSNSIELKNLPASLRHRQSFRLDAFQENIMGYLVQEGDERGKGFPPNPNPSLWKKIKGYLQTHKKMLTITISISMAVVLLIPTMGLLNRVDLSSPDLDTEAIQSRPSPGLIEQSDTISTQKISSSKTTTYTVNGVSFDMVSVAGGTFTMGATSEQGSDPERNEYPAHQVTLSDYMIGETEVTQELWQAVMGSNPSHFTGDNLPVEKVSWDECIVFIKKLNEFTIDSRPKGWAFCLPTEAEWEYAARGGNMSQNYKYSGGNDIDSVAWHGGNSSNKTHAVAAKSPNELGLHDMSGNVWEWCYDWYGSCSDAPQTNPIGPSSGSRHVIRGVGWRKYSEPWTVFHRISGTPGYNSNRLGLRLAMSIDENKGNK